MHERGKDKIHDWGHWMVFPVSWKDLFDLAGYETNAGSNLLKGRVSKNDCACSEKYINETGW
jgi:Asp-tRNA(Asn)/Glu-tRNA(Gln) amidotransferase A subunit family amidase